MRKRSFIVALSFLVLGASVQADDYVDDVYYWNTVGLDSDTNALETESDVDFEDIDTETPDTPDLLLYTYQTDSYDPGEFTHADVVFVEDSTLNQTTQVRAIIHRY